MESIVILLAGAMPFAIMGIFGYSEAFIITHLWRWYLVPIGIAPLSTLTAYGANLIVGVFCYRWHRVESEDRFKALLFTFITPWFAFALGWLVLRLFA